MKFGTIAVGDASGSILAHSVRLRGGVLRKGRTLDNDDLQTLVLAGINSVTVAQLESGDIDENTAALKIAEALNATDMPASGGRTGRANLRSSTSGIVLIDEEIIHRINAVDEAITLSTLPPYAPIKKGEVAATVKIITFGVAVTTVGQCVSIIQAGLPPVRIAPFKPAKVGFIQTLLPGLKDSLLEKATRSMSARLANMGLDISIETHCDHSELEISKSLKSLTAESCNIALVLGASAIVDRRDVVPSAVVHAGGSIEHLGLPVDPGNLMLYAKIGTMRILGLPGSARSIRPHGFDWVLQRLVAGLDVTENDLTRMGVGGLLKEMPGRPVSREQDDEYWPPEVDFPKIGAVLLAAGQSRRMGPENKMTVEIDGKPMVEHSVRALIESTAVPVVVVLGHEPEEVEKALSGMDVTFVLNPNYAKGLSTSLRVGLAALPTDCTGAVVSLGDMPSVTKSDINSLIEAFDPVSGHSICVPTHDGKRGNPVLWARRYFDDMSSVEGDVGARHLIGENADQVCEVATSNSGILIDLDTPDAVAKHTRKQ
ncbi:MAG: molybdopterin-binding/glycosyltransferase family 2 protein [Pseudomonadota bacterium]|nr:molybdopterin-binding/glycosyltransferase family 2 protein [Pseudomonadota bacterium]